MPEPSTDQDWLVVFETDNKLVERHVKAAYHRFADKNQPFIEFKRADHKVVFTIAASRVVMIGRSA